MQEPAFTPTFLVFAPTNQGKCFATATFAKRCHEVKPLFSINGPVSRIPLINLEAILIHRRATGSVKKRRFNSALFGVAPTNNGKMLHYVAITGFMESNVSFSVTNGAVSRIARTNLETVPALRGSLGF